MYADSGVVLSIVEEVKCCFESWAVGIFSVSMCRFGWVGVFFPRQSKLLGHNGNMISIQ